MPRIQNPGGGFQSRVLHLIVESRKQIQITKIHAGKRVKSFFVVTEKPDEQIAHVRICGGTGWVTTGPTRKFHGGNRISNVLNG
jgi:hypothetical protein